MTISKYVFSFVSCGLLLCLFSGTVRAQASDTCILASTSSAGALPGDYPRTNLRISLRVKYTKPGTVLDTVGINAAPAGSFALSIGSDGKPTFSVYDPGKESSARVSNGWHVITADTAIPVNMDGKITVDVLEKEIVLSVNGTVDKRVALSVELSGKTVYIGDNPDDDSWGDKYNIHPAMIGEVQVIHFGAVPKETPPPAPPIASASEAKPEPPIATCKLTSTSSSSALPGNYPCTNLRISLNVKYSKPGTVLDTVGINEAPFGSFTLSIGADGKLAFQVYEPTKESSARVSNGWHVLTANTVIPVNTDAKITVDVLEKEIVLSVNGKVDKRVALDAELSGKTVYIGDNPDDDSWGDQYNIHPAMIGEVQVLAFGAVPKETMPAPPAAVATEAKPETPPAVPPVAAENDTKPASPAVASAPAPEPAATDAPADGVKEIGKALDSGVVQTAVGAILPSSRKKYETIFTEHPEAMKRIAALLAGAKPKYTQGRYAEYEITDKGRTFTIVLEKIGDRWYLAQL